MSAIELAGPILADEGVEAGKAWILGGRITFERPIHTEISTIEGWAVPGFVDMHCHLGIGPSGPVDGDLIVKQAMVERDAGVLLIRDAGSATSLEAIEGRDDLPDVMRSGRFIARPKRYLKGYAVEVEPGELAAEAAKQARESGSWVKLIADWIDRELGAESDLAPLWEGGELADAVSAAHAEGARVTAHTFATESIDDLLASGIDCIEHGTGMTAAHMELAARLGVPVVPTLMQVANFESFAAQAGDRFPLFTSRMKRMFDNRYEQVRSMWESGVNILVGTDAGTSIAHGDLAKEAAQLAMCMPAADVVAAATWRARRFLGAPTLTEGAPADVVVLPADPREDIRALAVPTAVFLKGLPVI